MEDGSAAATADVARWLRVRRARAVAPVSEHKQVSVLFVDVCDSTAHVAQVDPEEAQDFLKAALTTMSEAVATYGGTISQLLGDGLVALFGAPVAQEDHALRACLAALAMQNAVADGDSGGAAKPSSVQLRVGIHSGEVLVGVAGSDHWSHYRADGTTIHLASRLERVAAPGSIVVSAVTQRLLQGQLDTRPLGIRSIRGFADEMALYELVIGAEGSAAAPFTRRERFAPLVGRVEALALLETLANRARSGGMRVVGLRGEAGIGKSRLISEWCASVAEQSFAVCVTYARGYAVASAYSLIAELIRTLLALPRSGSPATQMQAVRKALAALADAGLQHADALADLLGVAPDDADWLGAAPPQRRRRLADALHSLIALRLDSGPLLLVIEDIFLADRESQRLLESLIPRLDGLPLLICVSYRQDFEHRWSDEPWFVEHWLAPLHGNDMRALAGSMLGADPSLEVLVDELVERADGNPFFLEQMIVTLIDDGSLLGTPGGYRLTRPLDELKPPASIAAVIGARADRLSAAVKSALEAAAVLGDPIAPSLIGAMLEIGPDEAQRLLRLGVAAGLMASADEADSSSDAYRFRHALVQDVLNGTLTRPRRRALHRLAYFALAAHHRGDDLEASPVLTRHAFLGEVWSEAASHAVRSMARAVSRSANREALRLFELGLDAARRVDPGEGKALELALLLEAIGALMALGQLDSIYANLERAEVIARELGDRHRQSTVALQMAVFLWMRGGYTQGLDYATDAFEAGCGSNRRNLQMAARQARMMMFHGLGRYREAEAEALRVLDEFVPELKELRCVPGWATAPIINLYAFLASTLWRLGDYAAAEAACERAYEKLARVDHPYSRGLVDFVCGQIWIEQERYDEAQALMRASFDSCVRHDVPTLVPCSTAMLGSALARGGKAPEAVVLLGDGLRDRIHLAGGTYGEMFMRLNHGVALRNVGRWAEAIEAGERAAELARIGEQYGHYVEAEYELGLTLCAAEQRAAGREAFQRSLLQARRSQMPYYIRNAAARLDNLEPGADPRKPTSAFPIRARRLCVR